MAGEHPEPIQCYVALRIKEQLDVHAKARRVSRSELVRQIFDEWLATHIVQSDVEYVRALDALDEA